MTLDPDTPGALDLLTREQLKRYLEVYRGLGDEFPPRKHAEAWKAATQTNTENE